MPVISVDPDEVTFTAIRAQGAGGQNVNKVSNAVHLRFDIATSSLPDGVKQRLRLLADARITAEGVIVIKAQAYRSLEQNRAEALQRLNEMVERAAVVQKPRRATKPTYGSKLRRLEGKSQRAQVKAGRRGAAGGE